MVVELLADLGLRNQLLQFSQGRLLGRYLERHSVA